MAIGAGLQVSCGWESCVPLTRSPQALGQSLGQEREEKWVMQLGRHRTEHSVIASQLQTHQSCSHSSHLGHTSCTPGL